MITVYVESTKDSIAEIITLLNMNRLGRVSDKFDDGTFDYECFDDDCVDRVVDILEGKGVESKLI